MTRLNERAGNQHTGTGAAHAERRDVSTMVARWLVRLLAAALCAGLGLVSVRYGFALSSWGWDAAGMAGTAAAFTRPVYRALARLWGV